MQKSSDDILDRMRTREVTGVFHSRKALVAAAEDLLFAGVDRADIDVSASVDEVGRRMSYVPVPPADLADIPATPRRPFLGEDDFLVTKMVIASVSGCAVALGMALVLVAQDMSPLSVGTISVLSGLVVGGVTLPILNRRFHRDRVRGLEPASEYQGLLIWVRVRSPEQEAQAQEILIRHGGKAVHVHEIELTKRTEDLPLHSLRPDPWLGDERLGHP
jgi:hypothetical protein